MRVERGVSLLTVREQIEEARASLQQQAWHLDLTSLEASLLFRAYIASPVDREIYCFEFDCNDYPALPPLIEPIDLRTNQKGVPTAFPTSSDTFFHTQPVICIQFNRRAYTAYQGIHADWDIGQWQTAIPGVRTLGEMLGMLALRVSDPNRYVGRRRS